MNRIKEEEMIKIYAGASITAAYLNAAARAVNTILDFGRTVGSTIRRAIKGKLC